MVRGDGAAVVAALAEVVPPGLLQHAGSGLLVALAQQVHGAGVVAAEASSALVDRDYEGDEVLAAQLVAATSGEPTGRRPLPADLEAVADLLEGDLSCDEGGYLDRTTGDTWPISTYSGSERDDDIDFEDATRWLYVPNRGSADRWSDMRDFAVAIDAQDPVLGERLLDAVHGRGAFSRFQRTLDRYPDAIPEWLAIRDELRIGRARAWLADEGYDAVPPSVWVAV